MRSLSKLAQGGLLRPPKCLIMTSYTQLIMKIKPGYEETCYSMIDDGFWYTLTYGNPPKTPDDLMLESDEDAEEVMKAIQVLRKYYDTVEIEAKRYDG